MTVASRMGFRFQIGRFVSKQDRLKAKITPHFAFLDPLKIGKKWAKCLSKNEVQSSVLKVEILNFR